MIAALKTLSARVWGYVLLAGALALGLLTLHRSGKSAGRREVEDEIRKRDDIAKRKAAEISKRVDFMDPDDKLNEFDRLHNARRGR